MRRWLGRLLLPALLAVSPAKMPLLADTPRTHEQLRLDTRRIDRALKAMVAEGRTVGASVLVWQGGRERYFRVVGMADREMGRPFARNTLVQIFSMTKPVTGIAMMQLWEQGKFALDDPLARYLPEFADVRVVDRLDEAGNAVLRPPARSILVRDILRHTAGFVYDEKEGPVGVINAREDPLAYDHDLAEFGKRLARVPLLYDPGTRWHYSAAVDVQALLVERITGRPFAEYVQRQIFGPLKMDETAWSQPRERLARLARIYEVSAGGPLQPMPDARWLEANFADKPLTMGGSGLASTVDDYLRFARMLLGQGSLDGVRIIKPSTLRLMVSDQLDPAITGRSWLPGKGSLGFGFDFAVRNRQPQVPQENRGSVGEFFWDGGTSVLFWVDPANDLVVIFATQKLPFDGTLHHDIREAVYGRGYLGPKGD